MVISSQKYTFSLAELFKRERRKEVLADGKQPTAPSSTKSHVSYCAARARRREKMAPKVHQARRDDCFSSRLLSLLLTAATVGCGCHTRAPKPNLCVLCVQGCRGEKAGWSRWSMCDWVKTHSFGGGQPFVTPGDGNWDSSVNLCYSPMKFGMDIVHMSKKIQVQQDEKRPVGLSQRRQSPKLSAAYMVCRLQQKGETAVKPNTFHASPCW